MMLNISDATLYDFPYSSSSYRLRIALNLKGLRPKEVRGVDLRGGEHLGAAFVDLAGTPTVPVMDFDGAAYGQSLALIEWLDTAHPTPRLIPQEDHGALVVRGFALSIACEIHPLNVPRVLKRLTGEMGLSEADRKAWYVHWVREGFTVLERQLAAHAHLGGFCFGDQPTLADVCLVPQVLNARRSGVPIEDFERIIAIYDRCMAEEAFRRAAPAKE